MLGFRFGLRQRAAIGFGAGVAAGAAGHGVPVEWKIAVEIGADAVRAAAAVGVVDVLAPGQPGFGFFAAVGISLQHQIERVVVHQPCGFGVGAVTVDQPFGIAGEQFGWRVFARVDRTEQHHRRFVRPQCIGGRVGQPQHLHVVAARAVGLQPGGADGRHAGQCGFAGHELIDSGVGFFDRAVAGIAGNAARAELPVGHRGFDAADAVGGCLIDLHAQAHALQVGDVPRRCFRAYGSGGAVDDHVLEARRERLQLRAVAIFDGDEGEAFVADLESRRRRRRGGGRAGKAEQKGGWQQQTGDHGSSISVGPAASCGPGSRLRAARLRGICCVTRIGGICKWARRWPAAMGWMRAFRVARA